MNVLVKLIRNEDRIDIREDDQKWCLRYFSGGSFSPFCSGEYYGEGEGDAIGIEKTVVRGGITCKECLKQIRLIKAVKL